MRGKQVKRLRSIARRSATSENKVQNQERKTPYGIFLQRMLDSKSTKKLVKRFKQLLEHVPHNYKKAVITSLNSH